MGQWVGPGNQPIFPIYLILLYICPIFFMIIISSLLIPYRSLEFLLPIHTRYFLSFPILVNRSMCSVLLAIIRIFLDWGLLGLGFKTFELGLFSSSYFLKSSFKFMFVVNSSICSHIVVGLGLYWGFFFVWDFVKLISQSHRLLLLFILIVVSVGF